MPNRGICRETSRLARWAEGALLCVLAAGVTLYGGGKSVYNAGADAGISLVGVFVEYDGTNDVTAVEVQFTGNDVGVRTPVSVRNSDRDPWSALVKLDPLVTTDLATNLLMFTVAGNATTNRYWWVGSDTPAVIVEMTGVTVTNFVASSKFVSILWTCDDPKATVFEIQRRCNGGSQWTTVGTTEELGFVYSGFTVGETWQWRVSATYADVTEGDE